MYAVLRSLLAGLAWTVRTRTALQVEILDLRHQLAVLQRTRRERAPHRAMDRHLWVALHRLWPEWCKALVLVKPDTVIVWHRRGFRFCWNWRSRRGLIGRPGTPKEIRTLIGELSSSNVLWGAPRPHGELLKLGIKVSQATVARYMVKQRKPPSQTWRTFLENHFKRSPHAGCATFWRGTGFRKGSEQAKEDFGRIPSPGWVSKLGCSREIVYDRSGVPEIPIINHQEGLP
jgi:putative transposase